MSNCGTPGVRVSFCHPINLRRPSQSADCGSAGPGAHMSAFLTSSPVIKLLSGDHTLRREALGSRSNPKGVVMSLDCGIRLTGIGIPATALRSCVTLGMLPSLSGHSSAKQWCVSCPVLVRIRGGAGTCHEGSHIMTVVLVQ